MCKGNFEAGANLRLKIEGDCVTCQPCKELKAVLEVAVECIGILLAQEKRNDC